MYQHIDLLAAQSMAREREHDLQQTLRQRQHRGTARPVAADAVPEPAHGHHWVHDLLVRVHLVHATPH